MTCVKFEMRENYAQKCVTIVANETRKILCEIHAPIFTVDAIMRSYPEVDSQTEHFVGYIITYSPFAVWSKIAQGLYEKGERKALEIARFNLFIPPRSNNEGKIMRMLLLIIIVHQRI